MKYLSTDLNSVGGSATILSGSGFVGGDLNVLAGSSSLNGGTISVQGSKGKQGSGSIHAMSSDSSLISGAVLVSTFVFTYTCICWCCKRSMTFCFFDM